MSFTSPIPVRLKEARKKARLSQKALGVRIGMDEGSASARMNQYEKAKHAPDIQTLKLIANELGVPLNYFFCEEESSAKLACLIAKLSEEERQELINKLSGSEES
ncbi:MULTISPECIES: helix-turn-helix domain-containing protein [Vibrio harveyi group]|jgi:transcriptional regulator with XRE-family HTH domain|uniref:helix-turn-helix domain-containing protein n=1 Tax=Vibrio harveyi group TaxID=717610 RepID=UPI0004A31424|nr:MULTISPECIES: helix-turn-helix transcriptional regulator [Vibrio harveyi group]PAW07723.1 XRE family transcriptional regulator [Vibrio sp. V1B]CAK6716972.1 putative transcriptional regulator, phage repressor [Vibrio harveyi]